MVLPGDLEGESRGRKPYKPQPEVTRIGLLIVGLDVAEASVIVLELPLNNKIGSSTPDRLKSLLLGSSLSNETAKYSPPDSPTDMNLACNLMGDRLASVPTNRSFGEGRCWGRQRQFVKGLDRVKLGGSVVVKATAAIGARPSSRALIGNFRFPCFCSPTPKHHAPKRSIVMLSPLVQRH